jgi:cysteine sulfinate desulfinase/cysteine desulfurase-like protein
MESSYVIEALGYSANRPKESVRFSLGRPTKDVDIKKALAIIKMLR